MSKAIDFQPILYKNFPYSTALGDENYPLTGSSANTMTGSSAHPLNASSARKNYFEHCLNGLALLFQQSKAGRWLELISAVLSFGCLVVLLVQMGTGGPASVRLTQEVLLYTNAVSLTNAMHHLNFEYERWCDSDFRMNLEVPTWDPKNVNRHPLDVLDVFHNPKKKKSDGFLQGISTSVDIHYTTIDLFFIAVPIFVFSFLFQFARYWFYWTEKNPKGWYKPWLGPEFSRWTEYLCTAPLQIFLVCVAFGTTNISTLLGQVGMQAALVLFGYDIEQQIKKIYKRKTKTTDSKTRFHNILGWKDLRLYVYLGVSWLLHALIWSVILGRFYLQERQGELCEKQKDFRMPQAVTFIVWSQFGSFTCFGVVCTLQACLARPTIRQSTYGEHHYNGEDKYNLTYYQRWNTFSLVYAILSITAKTFLEVGFVWVVSIYKPFELASPANIESGFMVNRANQTCFSIVPQPVSMHHG